MTVIYSGVARGATILAEYSVFSGNFTTVAKDYLSKASHSDGRFTYTVDTHVFSFLADQGYTFIVVTDEASGRTVPMAVLDRIKAEFGTKYLEKGRVAKEFGLNGSFGKKLKEVMEHATQFPEEYSKVASVQKKVDEVKNIMSENIEKVLERGEKLDLLVDKTDNLMFEADRFQKSGRQLRRKFWWQNMKMKLVMGLVIILVIVIAVLMFCFTGSARCKSSSSSSSSPSPSPTPSPSPSPASGRRMLLDAAAAAMFF